MNALEEYKQLQEHRKLWSGLIMGWLRLMIPIGGVLFAFFSFYLTWIPKCCHSSIYLCFLPYFGWLLFVIPLFTWRIVAHHIDRQIVAIYPRLLQLEQILGWEIDTIYIFNNLSKKGWKQLEGELKPSIPCGREERRNYSQYQSICKVKRKDPYEPLLKIWGILGYDSVGSRGHIVQDIMVGIISVVTLAISSFLAMQNQNCCFWVIIVSVVLFIGVMVVLTNLICHCQCRDWGYWS